MWQIHADSLETEVVQTRQQSSSSYEARSLMVFLMPSFKSASRGISGCRRQDLTRQNLSSKRITIFTDSGLAIRALGSRGLRGHAINSQASNQNRYGQQFMTSTHTGNMRRPLFRSASRSGCGHERSSTSNSNSFGQQPLTCSSSGSQRSSSSRGSYGERSGSSLMLKSSANLITTRRCSSDAQSPLRMSSGLHREELAGLAFQTSYGLKVRQTS